MSRNLAMDYTFPFITLIYSALCLPLNKYLLNSLLFTSTGRAHVPHLLQAGQTEVLLKANF